MMNITLSVYIALLLSASSAYCLEPCKGYLDPFEKTINLWKDIAKVAQASVTAGTTINACFSKTESSLLKLYADLPLSRSDLVNSITRSCGELENPTLYENVGAFEIVENGVANILTGIAVRWASTFSKLDKNDNQKIFQAAIEKIKRIPDKLTRIQKTYMLVTQYQGVFDNETRGTESDLDGFYFGALLPGHVIDVAKKTGSGGVCRHFSSLLYWSLKQVARSPSSNGAEATKEDFNASYITGKLGNLHHVWVRVGVPTKLTNGKQVVQYFDLDTTLYPNEFSILKTRRSGLSEKERSNEHNECRALKECLIQVVNK